jgi:hypothetical protein
MFGCDVAIRLREVVGNDSDGRPSNVLLTGGLAAFDA